MKCEAEGRILVELPSTGGVTKDGKDWEKREYIMETASVITVRCSFFRLRFDGSC